MAAPGLTRGRVDTTVNASASNGCVMAKLRPRAYEYPRPAVTVDVVLFTVAGGPQGLRLRTLLVQRGEEPQKGAWAIPGGFVRENDELPRAAERELAEETGVRGAFL